MSSLPAWRCSASSFRNAPRIPATAPMLMRKIGMPTTKASTRATTPSTTSACHDARPGFDLDESSEREAGHADGRPRRAVVAEGRDVDIVHTGEVVHVPEEHRRLHDIRHRG